MFTFNESPPDIEQFNNRSKNLIADLFEDVPKKVEGKKIPAMENICESPGAQGSIFLLKEGNLKHERDGRLLFVFDEGDMVGIERMFLKPNAVTKVYSEFSSTVDEYDKADVLKAVCARPELAGLWTELLTAQINLYATLYAGALKEEVQQDAKFKNFADGETIIEENSTGKEVYIMLDGHAEVFVKGTRVGEVLADEIFGAFAAITGTPRTATVKATIPSTVLAMTTDNFRELLETRPTAVLKLVDNMARIIVGLNETVIQFSRR